MSGQRKNNMPLTQNGVITDQAILAYLKGELSPHDTAEFDKLLAADPFAREALEGLQIANAQKLKASFSELSHKIQEKSGSAKAEKKTSFTLFFRYAAVAALVAVFIGVAFLTTNYFNEQAQKLALKEEATTQEAAPLLQEADSQVQLAEAPITDTLSTEMLAEQSADISSINDSATQGIASNAETSQQVATKASSIAASPTMPPSPSPATKQVAAKPIAKEQETKQVKEATKQSNAIQTKTTQSAVSNTPKTNSQADAITGDAATAAIHAAEKKTEEKNDKLSESMEDAMESFNNRDYKDAAKKFNKIASKDPSNLDAIYFEGISQFINGDNNKALKNFDKLLSNGAKHSDGSKWYKAQILLKKGKKEDAKKLLNDLKEGNSSFKDRAIKKLTETE